MNRSVANTRFREFVRGHRGRAALRSWLAALCALITVSGGNGATFLETFETDPSARGWKVHGDQSLFRWEPSAGALAVTWDSSKSNSLLYLPLGTILTRADHFGVVFELRMADIAAGTNPDKPLTFEVALGFARLADVAKTNFFRGVGIHAANGPRNLVEFDYFPDTGFGATIAPTMVSSNNQFATGFNFPFELTPGDVFRVAMTCDAASQTLATVVTRNGDPFGPIRDVRPAPGFTDFRLDVFAVISYSDTGADGSLLAHGFIDNLALQVPDPPVSSLAANLTPGAASVEFDGQPGWYYTLERTEDFAGWVAVSATTPGVEGRNSLTDSGAPVPRAYYRVRAERP